LIKVIITLSFTLSACSNLPKCGNPIGAKIVFSGKETCHVRIRQVTVGSDLPIPQSLKDAGLFQMTLEWVEPTLSNGKIELGHFVLQPSNNNKGASN
jgi:hypothetical protein